MDRLPYGQGVYRRRTLLVATEGRVVADLEDDFHRFRVEIEHDGSAVRGVRGVVLRHPWTECPGALAPLQTFAGTPLSTSPSAATQRANPRENCTHLFDLAALAVAHAAAERTRRQYDVAVPDRVDGRTRATLHRNGMPLLAWALHGSNVQGPPPFAGHELRGGAFVRWAEAELDPDAAEAAIFLRRSVFVANGRCGDLDTAPDAAALLRWAGNSCHAFTPGIAETALRVPGATLEFSHEPGRLLADVLG